MDEVVIGEDVRTACAFFDIPIAIIERCDLIFSTTVELEKDGGERLVYFHGESIADVLMWKAIHLIVMQAR